MGHRNDGNLPNPATGSDTSSKIYTVEIGGKIMRVSEIADNPASGREGDASPRPHPAHISLHSQLVIKVIGFVLTAVVGGFLLQVYKTADWQNRRDIEAQRGMISFQREHFGKISRDMERRYLTSARLIKMITNDNISQKTIDQWEETGMKWYERYHYYHLLLKTFVDQGNPQPRLHLANFKFRIKNKKFNFKPSPRLERDCTRDNGGNCIFVEKFCNIKGVDIKPAGARESDAIDLSKYKLPKCLDQYCAKRGRYFSNVCMHPYEDCLSVADPKRFAVVQKAELAAGNSKFGTHPCHTSSYLHFLHKCYANTISDIVSPWLIEIERAKRNGTTFSIPPAIRAQIYADLRCSISDLNSNQQKFYKVINHRLTSSLDKLHTRKKRGVYTMMMDTLETLMPLQAREAEIED